MITNPPENELFFPRLNVARKGDAPLNAACLKIEGKLKEYAKSRGIKADELRLFDVCNADAELHPKLRIYINTIPQLKKQTNARYEKYKEEISSHIQRAIDVVAALITGAKGISSSDHTKPEIPALLHSEHPILSELYELLPRQEIRTPGILGFQRGEKITEAGCLFYLSCAEFLKRCSPSSLHELISEYRHVLTKSFKIVCLSSPDKIASLNGILVRLCKKLDIKRQSKRRRLPVAEWPSPLREEMQVLQAVGEGKLMEGLEEKIADAGVEIEIHSSMRPISLINIEANVERLMFRYCPGRERLSVRDILSTTMTEVVGANGKVKPVYYNPVLSPFRESERARESVFKRAGYDSAHFSNALSSLRTIAMYNGIFEYHEIIREAFEINLDVDRIEQRKAHKKNIIKRHALDQWIEDNFTEYKRILTQGLFRRDKDLRPHPVSDRNMRFVLFYPRLTTLKVMGYRQRQLRDCKDGVNLIVTRNSIEFTYTEEETKTSNRLHFIADIDNFEATHGRLIETLDLFHRYAFPYVQENLKPWQTGDEEQDRRLDPKGQVFVHLTHNGKFSRFHPEKNRIFSALFTQDSRSFLKHPDLQLEAALLSHSHYMRGSSMDTQILDNGMSLEVASKYYGVSRKVIESKYKDKNAVLDASRDVMLQNAEMEELEARKKRNRAKRGEKPSGAIEAELRQQLRESEQRERESQERERKKDERIAGLEMSLAQIQTKQEKQHEELMEAIRGSNRQGNRYNQTKTTKPSTRCPKRTKPFVRKDV
jgi:hypothetical protein